MAAMRIFRAVGVILALGAIRAAAAQRSVVRPGDARLQPARVRLGTDTIVVLVDPVRGSETSVATLVRRMARVPDGAGGDDLRETQHYVYGHGVVELDTLEVSAATLALRHIVERSTHTRNVLDVAHGRLRGIVTPTDSTVDRVDIAAPAAFHDMMLEAFTAAFPFSAGASLSLPTLRPPDTGIRIIDVDVSRSTQTLRTADGPVECLVVTRRGRDVATWISKADGHIVRMRWTNADGSVTWKLPARDVPFRQ